MNETIQNILARRSVRKFDPERLPSEEQIQQIVRMQMRNVAKMLAHNGITLNTTDAAIKVLAQAGYDPEFGARTVKRVIQRLVLNELSKDILAQKVNRERPIVIDVDADKLVFRN